MRCAFRVVPFVIGHGSGCDDGQAMSGMRMPADRSPWRPHIPLYVNV
jgi:hypothetical protein